MARIAVVVCIAAWLGVTGGCGASPESAAVDRIGFGSCARQGVDQPIWGAVRAAEPDLFVFLGDNIYADTTDLDALRAAYAALAAKPGFARLREEATVLATWDDHDYGRNDAGAAYEGKAGSQRAFLDFFGEPADSRRRKTPGVYDAEVFGPPGRRVQVILLDTRYFRGPLKRWPAGQRPTGEGPYIANNDPAATMLGAAQWAWLEDRLREPAALRLIASSIQFVAEQHHWEKWANLPHERRRMLKLIERTGAEGVVFLSGDRHLAEISVLDEAAPYPIYDVTSSSLTHTLSPRTEPNRHRVGELVFVNNFGLIQVDWSAADPVVTMQVRDESGGTLLSERVRLSELRGR